MRNMAFSQSTIEHISTFYFVDFENESVSGYYLFNDIEFGSRWVSSFNPSSYIDSTFNEFVRARKDVSESFIDVSPVSSGTSQNKVFSSSQSPHPKESASTTNDIKVCTNTSEMYAYITTSYLRSQGYSRAILQSPTMQTFRNTWNRLVSAFNAEISVGVISAAVVTIPTRVTWEGAGSAAVVANPHADTFDIVDGSVMDCNGNVIPTQESGLGGNFVFGSFEEGQNFQSYVNLVFGTTTELTYTHCALSFQTTCSRKSDGEYECKLIVPRCLR
ncbi:hypothetical protein ACYTPF_16130 [Alteromonas sp. HB246098]